MSSEDLKPPEFEAVGNMMVKITKSIIDDKKLVDSSRISSPDDPHPPDFKIRLSFGGEVKGFLSGRLVNASQRRINVRYVRCIVLKETLSWPGIAERGVVPLGVGVAGVVLNPLCYTGPSRPFVFLPGHFFGFPMFLPLPNIGSDEESEKWHFIFKVLYDGVSINTVDEYINDQPKDMLSLFESGNDADVTFNLGKETVKAHKSILKARSPYFESMLNSGMKESLTNKIELRDVDPAVFKEVLKFIYSGLPPVNLSNLAMDLFPLADKYGIVALKDLCDFAIRGILSAENVVDVLILADLHHAQDLKDVCVSVLKKNGEEIQQRESWKRLIEYPHLMLSILATLLD